MGGIGFNRGVWKKSLDGGRVAPYAPPPPTMGNSGAGNKLPAIFVKNPICTGYLLPTCKIFMERPAGVNFFLALQCSEQEILAAKIDEIEKWKENHVFEPIYYNGQKRILTRWVLPEKFVHRKKIIAKA